MVLFTDKSSNSFIVSARTETNRHSSYDNSDSINITNVVGLFLDQVMDKLAPDPAVVPTNTSTLYPELKKQSPNQVAFSPTPIPIKVPIVPAESKVTMTPTIERYECSL